MLVEFNINHLPEVIQISDTVLGTGFLTTSTLNKYIDSKIKKALVYLKNEAVIGFICFDLVSPKELKESVLLDNDSFYTEFQSYNKIGFIKQVLVHPHHQKQGIGKMLIGCFTSLPQNKKVVFLCIAWGKENSIPIEKALLHNSFVKSKTINNYWSKDSIKNNYNCEVCETPPCKCNAVVFIKVNLNRTRKKINNLRHCDECNAEK